MSDASQEIHPFRIEIPQADLDEVAERLARTRFANELPMDTSGPQTGPVPPGWEYGVPVGYVRDLVDHWQHHYDWRAWEARLNSYPQFRTEIDGQPIHFLHVRSPEPDALPLILSHGWPNTFLEYVDLIAPLTDPTATAPRPPTPSMWWSRRCPASGSPDPPAAGLGRPADRASVGRAHAAARLPALWRARQRRRRDRGPPPGTGSTPSMWSGCTSTSCSPSPRATRPSSRA